MNGLELLPINSLWARFCTFAWAEFDMGVLWWQRRRRKHRSSETSDALSIMRLESILPNIHKHGPPAVWPTDVSPALTINSFGKSHFVLGGVRLTRQTHTHTASVSQNNIALLKGISFYEIIKAIIIHNDTIWDRVLAFSSELEIHVVLLCEYDFIFRTFFLPFFFLLSFSFLASWQHWCGVCASVFDATACIHNRYWLLHVVHVFLLCVCACSMWPWPYTVSTSNGMYDYIVFV